jgi:hypothetical protein
MSGGVLQHGFCRALTEGRVALLGALHGNRGVLRSHMTAGANTRRLLRCW